MSDFGQAPSPQDLQFQHAEPIAPESAAASSGPVCVPCQQPVGETYYHAQGQVICPLCAFRIQNGQQAPPALSLLRAALYGGGAALAGCTLYALVAIILNAEIGIIAILVGWMVGKAIRHASNGMGGRPQQILAVVLTYFAISTSYIPVMIYQFAKNPDVVQKAKAKRQKQEGQVTSDDSAKKSGRMSAGALLFGLLTLAAIAPFLSLSASFSGVIGLFILFIGLQRAWRLTGRTEILVMGPYPVEAAP